MKVVSYYRVSTARQGESGLGLEAQEAAVQALLAQRGGEEVGTFTEVESGRKADRPQLARAIAAAKRMGAVLCIAKADRLSRSVAFTAAILESGLEVIAADMPHAGRFEWHIRAAIAEEEARAISARTKAALAAAKARGTVLGFAARPEAAAAAGAKGGATGGRKSAATRAAAADAFAAEVGPVVVELHRQGHSLRQIAAQLEAQGIATPRGGRSWQAVQVRAVLLRAA